MPRGRAAARIEGLIKSRKVDGRGVYSKSAKAALVEACRQPGISVAASALANGINANLLRKWMGEFERKQRSAKADVLPSARDRLSALLPIRVTPETAQMRSRGRARKLVQVDAVSATVIELEYREVRITLRGGVDTQQLEHVLGCIRRTT